MPGRSGARRHAPEVLGKPCLHPALTYLFGLHQAKGPCLVGSGACGALAQITCTEDLWLAGTGLSDQLWRLFPGVTGQADQRCEHF